MLTLFALFFFGVIGSLLLNVWAVADKRFEDEVYLRVWDDTRTLGEMLALAYFVPGAALIIGLLWATGRFDREESWRCIKRSVVAIVKPPHGI